MKQQEQCSPSYPGDGLILNWEIRESKRREKDAREREVPSPPRDPSRGSGLAAQFLGRPEHSGLAGC